MNRLLLWCFFTLFSAELFSSYSSLDTQAAIFYVSEFDKKDSKNNVLITGLRTDIERLDIPDFYKKAIKDTLFFDGIDIYTELSKAEQQRLTELKKSRHLWTKARIKTLRLMLTPSYYTEEDMQTTINNNKIAIKFLFNHCNDLENLTLNIVAALTDFDVTIDLDDNTVDIKSIVSAEKKEEVFNGRYGNFIPNDFKK